MSAAISSISLSPILPTDLLGGGAMATGGSQADKIKQVSKAMEGIFASQLMSELGKGLGGSKESTGLYQDFIQQALAQQVTSGGGFGLARFIENSLTPATHHALGAGALKTSPHVPHAK